MRRLLTLFFTTALSANTTVLSIFTTGVPVFIIALFAVITLPAFANVDKPAQRIVSINLCLDALLIKLVEPQRVDSIYYLSANPQFSSVFIDAKKYNLNHGLAEEIMPRNPDLVLAGAYTSPDLITLLKQLHVRIEVLDLPQSLNDISAHIRHFGQLVNRPAQAEAMAQSMEKKLVQLDKVQKQLTPIPGFWYSSNGVVVGGDTLENELMTRAGFRNLALDKHISGFKQLDLEELILARPKVLIMEASDVHAFSLAQEYLQHPALRSHHIKIIRLPSTLSCVAPVAADAIENLMQERQKLAP